VGPRRWQRSAVASGGGGSATGSPGIRGVVSFMADGEGGGDGEMEGGRWRDVSRDAGGGEWGRGGAH
jgi:hypothetical protein